MDVLDGDLATEWPSQGDDDDAYITIDDSRQVHVTAVGFETRSIAELRAAGLTAGGVGDGVAGHARL